MVIPHIDKKQRLDRHGSSIYKVNFGSRAAAGGFVGNSRKRKHAGAGAKVRKMLRRIKMKGKGHCGKGHCSSCTSCSHKGKGRPRRSHA